MRTARNSILSLLSLDLLCATMVQSYVPKMFEVEEEMSSEKSPYKSCGLNALKIFHGKPIREKPKKLFSMGEWTRIFKGRKRKRICVSCGGRGMIRAKLFSNVLISCQGCAVIGLKRTRIALEARNG